MNLHLMVNFSMTKETSRYNKAKTASSIDGVGKLDSYMQNNQTGIVSYIIYKNKLVYTYNGILFRLKEEEIMTYATT